jgi:3-hydroxyisobutyrate dehydrogenase
MAKDLRTARDLITRLGLDGELARPLTQIWEEAATTLPSGADHTEIGRYLGASA